MLHAHLFTTAFVTALLVVSGAGAAHALADAEGPAGQKPAADTAEAAAVDAAVTQSEATCVVVIWTMPGWVDQWTPTWPQSFDSVHDADCSTTQIDAANFPLSAACDTQYQLDKYYVSEKTSALIAGGVLLGYGPEEDAVPGMWGTLVHNAVCDLPTYPNWSASVSVVDETCDVTGAAIRQAVAVVFPEGTPGLPHPVRYYLAYDSVERVELTAPTTVLPEGSYVVSAVVTDENDSINDAGARADFAVRLVAQEPGACDQLETLALTGPGDHLVATGAGAVVALMFGVGAIADRRRRSRG